LALDLAVVAGLLVAALVGAATGALRQLVQLAAAVLGWLAARHLAAPVARGLARALPEAGARLAAPALLFAGVFALASVAGAVLLRAGGLHRAVRSPADRGLGALLGGAKGAFVAWVLLSVLVLAGGPVGAGRLRVDPRDSDLAGFARAHNLVARVDPTAARRLERLMELLRDPRRLDRDGDARRLLEDPRVRALGEGAADDASRAAAAERLAADPELRALVDRIVDRDADGRPGRGPGGGAR
jgi:membrane protein required for colicin V production